MKDSKKYIVYGDICHEYCGDISGTKRANFSVESNDNKPYDISLMTGSNNQTESEDDEQ